MNAAPIDAHLIKTPLLVFIGALVVTFALVLSVMSLLDGTRQSFNQINQAVSADQETLQKRLEGNELYHTLQSRYRALLTSNLNQPDKLMWMEQLQLQAEHLSLPALTYSIKARQVDAGLNATLTAGFSVYATPIEVKLGLVHEGQLLYLSDDLLQAGLGTFSFEYCELKLNEKIIKFQPAVDNINVECLLKWFEIVRTETMDAELAAGTTS
jgi:hypothetical protein